MAIARQLQIDTDATALDMANAMFGSGIQVISADFQGAASQSGIYTDAGYALQGISPTDTGVIFSTGHVDHFAPYDDGSTDTNRSPGTSFVHGGTPSGDADLDALAGGTTYDAAVFTANFIPDGNWITLQFVFSSEEYLEYVGSGFNDAFGVWVNGVFAPVNVVEGGVVSIDTVNTGSNSNLYQDNPASADLFATEMDGLTRVLTVKAPVQAGQVNTIKIGIADALDTAYDSNVLIMGDSIQSVTIAFEDHIDMALGGTRTVDVLLNDLDTLGGGLTITHINDVPITAGQTVVLPSGDSVTLHADGTLTVQNGSPVGENIFTYTVVDAAGQSDIGMVKVNTHAELLPDGIVQGSGGDDVIDGAYTGDPDGDMIDADDALGVGGTTGDGDYVLAMGGDDLVLAGAGDDIVYGGWGNDTIHGGAGNDRLLGEEGDDSIYGGEGDDTILGGAGNDQLFGGAGRDVLHADGGNDTLTGGAGDDVFVISPDAGAVLITDFGSGNTGAIDDGDSTNNDFVDLSAFYNETTLAAWNAANPDQTYKTPLHWMQADHADGVLDAVGGGLRIQNDGAAVSPDMLVFETTGVICFARGTRILTPRGEIAVEALRPGDFITTMDAGPQVLRWIGMRRVGAAELAREPGLNPVHIRAGSFGHGMPHRDLTVSPQHRILLRSRIVERMTGEAEALLAAKHMTGLDGVEQARGCEEVDYFHLLFDRHQILFAEGAPAESLLFGTETRKTLAAGAEKEILAVLPGLALAPPAPARRLMDGRTGRSLIRRMKKNGAEPICGVCDVAALASA